MAADVVSARAPLARGTGSFFYRWSGHYRRAIAELRTWASSELPKAPNEKLALADRLFALQEAKRQFSQVETEGRAIFGAAWRSEATPFVELSQTLAWVDSVRAEGHECSLASSIAAARKDGLLSTLRASLAAKMRGSTFDVSGAIGFTGSGSQTSIRGRKLRKGRDFDH